MIWTETPFSILFHEIPVHSDNIILDHTLQLLLPRLSSHCFFFPGLQRQDHQGTPPEINAQQLMNRSACQDHVPEVKVLTTLGMFAVPVTAETTVGEIRQKVQEQRQHLAEGRGSDAIGVTTKSMCSAKPRPGTTPGLIGSPMAVVNWKWLPNFRP